jgi:hypothetical protein
LSLGLAGPCLSKDLDPGRLSGLQPRAAACSTQRQPRRINTTIMYQRSTRPCQFVQSSGSSLSKSRVSYPILTCPARHSNHSRPRVLHPKPNTRHERRIIKRKNPGIKSSRYAGDMLAVPCWTPTMQRGEDMQKGNPAPMPMSEKGIHLEESRNEKRKKASKSPRQS